MQSVISALDWLPEGGRKLLIQSEPLFFNNLVFHRPTLEDMNEKRESDDAELQGGFRFRIKFSDFRKIHSANYRMTGN